jgi:hypothetical protein
MFFLLREALLPIIAPYFAGVNLNLGPGLSFLEMSPYFIPWESDQYIFFHLAEWY